MIYSNDKETDDCVVEILATKEHSAAELHGILCTHHKPLSIQAVYDVLRKLERVHVVVKQKRRYALSAEWRRKVAQKLETARPLPELGDGERVRYTFTSYHKLDAYWKHINVLLGGAERDSPVFFYDAHEFWIYLGDRTESQDAFLRSFSPQERQAFIVIGGTTSFDKRYKERYGKYLEIVLTPHTTLVRHEHLTVYGEYIIVTHIPKAVARHIDDVYETTTSEEGLAQELNALFLKPQHLVVTLMRDAKRARTLRKYLSKDMYVPLELRNKYDF